MAVGLVAAAAGAAVVMGGLYDVSATSSHTAPVRSLLEEAMHRSVRLRARGVEVPEGWGTTPAQQALGAACYRQMCVQCHGGPGEPPSAAALGLQPEPGSLVDAARRWHPRELYWITRHGLKMTGMPAWAYRLSEDELWAVVGFVRQLPALSAVEYRYATAATTVTATQACGRDDARPAVTEPGLDRRASAERVLRQHACTTCHRIPGVPGADVHVGPPLDGFGRRTVIAGRLPNTPENLARWLQDPQAIKPGSAMPALGVSEAHAREMADYLSTLR
jgi:cytochrome c1